MEDKQFTNIDQQILLNLLAHRRDVRGNLFNDLPVSDDVVNNIIRAGLLAPSVGYSQPWEFVVIRDNEMKQSIAEIFEAENQKALKLFENDENKQTKAQQYASLKLEGILATPVNIAVFYKPSTALVLGQTSMEEAGEYSVVCAVQNMWLMSRALNIGMGWVSILNADAVKGLLNAPKENKLVAYLCLGNVDKFLEKPELETLNWEEKKSFSDVIINGKYA